MASMTEQQRKTHIENIQNIQKNGLPISYVNSYMAVKGISADDLAQERPTLSFGENIVGGLARVPTYAGAGVDYIADILRRKEDTGGGTRREFFPLAPDMDFIPKDPIGGTEQIQQAYRDTGLNIDAGRGTWGGRVGEEIGMTMPFVGAAARAGVSGKGLLKTQGEDFLKSPKRYIGAETTGAVGAATGGHYSQDLFYGSELLGEVVGGIAGVAPYNIAQKGKQTLRSWMPGGPRKLAADLLQDRVQNRENSVARIRDPKTDGTAYAANIAEIARDEGLAALYRSMEIADVDYGAQGLVNKVHANKLMVEDLERYVSGGLDSESATPGEFFRGVVRRRNTAVDKAVDAALKQVKQIIEELGSNLPQSSISLIARQHLEEAYRVARDQEELAWAKVPDTATRGVVDMERLRSEVFDMIAKREKGDKLSNYPADALRIIGLPANASDEMKREIGMLIDEVREIDRGGLPFDDVETLRSIQSVRSALYKDLQATDNPSLKKNIHKIREILMDVLEGGPKDKGGAEVTAAIAESRRVNEIFTHEGPVAALLERSSKGGNKVADELTLEQLRQPGPKSEVFLERLEQASGETTHLAEEFLRSEFMHRASKDGEQINIRAAEEFLSHDRGYGAVLDRMPGLKTQIIKAVGDQRLLSYANNVKDFKTRATRLKARLATWIDSDPVIAVGTTLGNADPQKAMRAVVRTVKKDKSGASLEGLKRAMIEYILDKTVLGSREFISPSRYKALINKRGRRKALEELFNPAEMKVLDDIGAALENRDFAETATPRGGSSTAANQGAVGSIIAGIIGAATGRWTTKKIGGGTIQTPAIMAGASRNFYRNAGAAEIKAILEEAMTNRYLALELLTTKATRWDARELQLTRGYLIDLQADTELLDRPSKKGNAFRSKLRPGPNAPLPAPPAPGN